jgi:hypothetical protein
VGRSGDMVEYDAATGADCMGYEERRSIVNGCQRV